MARDRSARPEAKPVRLFVAVEVTGPQLDALEEALAPWREAFPEARWVPRENLHITVKFLGRTWPRLMEWVPERVAAAAGEVRPFRAALAGLGSFPSGRRGRVLWAGLGGDEGGFARLATDLDDALSEEFSPERRPFHPHLTVARSDPPLSLPPAFAETALASDPWEVDHVVLFRSHLRRPTPRYEPLGRFSLRG
ncbi:MAG TPA: RNA 2',3'-cyclic phosphodiesterase [Actinomycetota bacterium]|nr:RNA 2',3'-cyclic phosphodiesterase [Actinomycetota bacterium]